MRAKSPSPVSAVHTKSWQALEHNLDSVKHMLDFGTREVRLLKAKATRLATIAGRLEDPRTKASAAKLDSARQRFLNAAEVHLGRFGTATLWQVVMLVTCVEVYLQDTLSAAAGVGPELMSESQQRAPYADVIAADSLDELASEMRTRWARGWLNDGGPTRWIARLEKMGARGYPTNLAPRLELIWGIRHTVVHAGGVANAEFVKRHPDAVSAAGDPLRVSTHAFGIMVRSVLDFVEPTEAFFLARYPSLVAEAPADSAL